MPSRESSILHLTPHLPLALLALSYDMEPLGSQGYDMEPLAGLRTYREPRRYQDRVTGRLI